MEVKNDILWRVYLGFLGLMLLGILILGKAFYTQNVEGGYWKSMGDSMHTRIIDLAAERGTIYSEDGSMLSTSLPQFDIYIDFAAEGLRAKNGERFNENIDSLSIELANLFHDKTAATYKKELKQAYKTKSRYYSLRKKVSFEEYKELRSFPLVRLGKNKSGFIAEVKTKRLNPFGELGFRTIGLYRENSKLVGLERSFDSVLRGTTGKRLVRYVSGGVLMPVEGYEVEPENGDDVYTTLDVNIQDITERALMRTMTTNQALEGTCIVMEVATGKIKAIANLGRTPEGTYFETDNYALRTGEPGSTIKLVTLLAALEDKHVTINDNIAIHGGRWNLNGRNIVDDHKGPEVTTIKHAFTQSSNVAMSKLAYQYYTADPRKYYKHFSNLHLTGKTGIELNEEFNPLIKNPNKAKYWHPQTLASWGFGYELMVSPLQMLMVYNAVANNGKMMKPYLLNEIRNFGTVVRKNEPVVLNEEIASESTIKQLQEVLAAVCTEGTAKKQFETAPYRASGKTGTAKVNDGTYKYRDGVYQSAFAGYFPSDAPKYSIIVVVKNRPRAANYYGGTVAAPVFREIADHLYKYSQEQQPFTMVKPYNDTMRYSLRGMKEEVKTIYTQFGFSYADQLAGNWRISYLKNRTVESQAVPVSDERMPDVKGMGLKDALYVLESAGMKVEVTGTGRINQQSIAAGSPVAKGQKITIYLN
jgi:cell division protein FtsI (penicillin-binding protein 3)